MAGSDGRPGICGSEVGNDTGSEVGTGNHGIWNGELAGTSLLAGCGGTGAGPVAPRGPGAGASVSTFTRGARAGICGCGGGGAATATGMGGGRSSSPRLHAGATSRSVNAARVASERGLVSIEPG
jgi:hypothetical protein